MAPASCLDHKFDLELVSPSLPLWWNALNVYTFAWQGFICIHSVLFSNYTFSLFWPNTWKFWPISSRWFEITYSTLWWMMTYFWHLCLMGSFLNCPSRWLCCHLGPSIPPFQFNLLLACLHLQWKISIQLRRHYWFVHSCPWPHLKSLHMVHCNLISHLKLFLVKFL